MNIPRNPKAQPTPRFNPSNHRVPYNPQPMPEDSPNYGYMNVTLEEEVVESHMYGIESVMVVIRRLSALGFTVVPSQEVVGSKRVITWRIGTQEAFQVIITYNLTWGFDWFGLAECPCNVNDGVDLDTMFEYGEGMIGPRGEFTFDDDYIIKYLQQIESSVVY